MKKYKHIKTGHIANETISNKNYKVSHPQTYTIPKWMIEDSKEWIEVIDRNFEIQTIKRKGVMASLIRSDYNMFYTKGGLMGSKEKELLSSPLFYIESVKRLHDGAIFSIGDSVMYSEKSSLVIGLPFIVDNILLRNDDRLLLRSKDNLMCEYIEDVVICNTPLFTTTDGVDIFLGNKYVIWDTNKINKPFEFSYDFATNEVKPMDISGNLIFSSLEAAKKHKLWSTPSVSLYDLKQFIGEDFDLKDLIKKLEEKISK